MGCNLEKNIKDSVYEPLNTNTNQYHIDDEQMKQIIKKYTMYDFTITQSDQLAYINHFGITPKFIYNVITKKHNYPEFSPLEIWVIRKHINNRKVIYNDYKLFGYALCYIVAGVNPMELYKKILNKEVGHINIPFSLFKNILTYKTYTINDKAILLVNLLGNALIDITMY